MSDDTPTNTPAPRRSQREKKTVQPFASAASGSSRKRKRQNDSDTEDEAQQAGEPSDALNAEGNEEIDAEEEGDDYRSPKVKATGSARKGKAKQTPKAKDAPSAKKLRPVKVPDPKPLKPLGRRSRKVKEGQDAYDATQVAKDTKIAADNPLFNAIMNPAAALQSTAEDFLESLDQSPAAAQAELINLILRSCGCNDSVDADEAVDYDGVVDALDNFVEVLKQENTPIYPLTSKLPIFKKFRKSLSEFIERLIASAADLGSLYTTDLLATVLQWVVAMSSSQIRSFRHTATVIALEIETALCDVAAAVEKEAEVVVRQREGERKRKASNKGGSTREKELISKTKEISTRRSKLAEYLKEFIDGVFVHRYRDTDPNIRAECVHAIGLWFRKYPGHFIDGAYLRYVGWVLSDPNTHVRLEAVRALMGVYDQEEYIGPVNHFTERFKPRLLEMGTGDTELAVRVAVIQVLGAIDGHSLLEEEERERLCLLIFDDETKVRRAVSRFVRAVWEEAVEARLEGRNKVAQKDKDRVGVKALAALLVKWNKALDTLMGDTDDSENGDANDADEVDVGDSSRPASGKKEFLALSGVQQKGRMALAVDALWGEVEPVSDWNELLDVLLLDHSAIGEENANATPRRANGKKHAQNMLADESWRLEEVEETILLEVLVAALKSAKAEAAGAKKGEENGVTNDITRALIKALPRLFIKYQTDQKRIADVLLLPVLMNLDLYLEMRMLPAYATLWDDVIKQFISHSSMAVLAHAIAAIQYFMNASSLSNTNSTKILEVEDELSSALRDTVAGRDEIEMASFSEDEVLALSSLCTRLAVLAGSRDMTAWMEEDEGGKQSSAWDIINALVERGRLGYKEEAIMIEQALHVLTLHIIWKCKGLITNPNPSADEINYRETLKSQRESLLEKLIEYAVGTQSNTVAGVKRAAFRHLLDLHVLFCATNAVNHDSHPLPTMSIPLRMDEEVQYRCTGYIQAEIERYAEFLDAGAQQEEANGKSDDGSDEEQAKSDKATNKRSHVDVPTSRVALEQEYVFIDVVSTFLRAIRAGAIDINHGSVLLAHYGRLGLAFDTCSKLVVDVLREEGMINSNGEVVVNVITQALKDAYTLVLDGIVDDETNSIQLAKLLSSCFIIRGAQLFVVRRLESHYIVDIHTTLLSWIGKRVAIYESNKNKRSLNSAIIFFKVLTPLLSTTEARDALKIKAHMDQVLAQAKVEISATSKAWEPQRVYEKRLGAVMSKEKGSGIRNRRGERRVKSATAETSEDDDESEHENPSVQAAPTNTIRPRPRPLRVTRNNPIVSEEQMEENIEDEQLLPTTEVFTALSSRAEESPQRSDTLSDPEVNQPPVESSRKRPRVEDEDDSGRATEEFPEPPATPVADAVRRKRIRH